MVALGHHASGLMGNDKKLLTRIEKSAKESYDKVWQLPLWEDYKDDLKSEVADIKNLQSNSYAGAIMAGIFLKKFVDDFDWAHIDIAGPAWMDKPKNGMAAGATGAGVHLLIELARNYCNK